MLSLAYFYLFNFQYQSNFATLDEETGIVVSRRADRHFEEEGPILCAALDGMKLPSFPEYEIRVRYIPSLFSELLCPLFITDVHNHMLVNMVQLYFFFVCYMLGSITFFSKRYSYERNCCCLVVYYPYLNSMQAILS